MAKKTRKFKAEVSQVLSLVINSLYSNKEIFLRELVSNASDALDKLRFEALGNEKLMEGDSSLKVRILCDEDEKTVTIWDNGIGMSEEELITLLGTVAHSGSKGFMEALSESGTEEDLNIIGQFGVGFYSSFLVADKVDVISKKAGSDQAFKWSSNAKDNFTVEGAERESRGTSIILHIKDSQEEFLNPFRLRTLVTQYSDFVGYPIEMLKASYGEEEGEEKEPEFEQVNQAQALWKRSPSSIEEEQYVEFYKHLTHDWEPPVGQTHFTLEGKQLFTGLLYIPSRPPFDLFDPDAKHGVRLYVKRVFIMENAEELVPRWLRFVRGIIDSEDLPLNVSREILQDSRLVKTIKKQVTKKTLELLTEISIDKPDDYKKIWENYGTVLKEGLHFAPDHKKALSKLIRFESSTHSEPSSLADYIERMPDDQESIYYALGASRALLEGSPHLEMLKKKKFEILYLTDSIDQWAIETLSEFDGKELVDALKGELNLDDDQSEEETEKENEVLKPLTEKFQNLLEDQVSEVRLSHRLSDSPACLVTPEGGVAAHIERLLRAQNQSMPVQKRILELNPKHPLIDAIQKISKDDDQSDTVQEWVELIYDQALLAEGSPISKPGLFAKRITSLMEKVATAQLT